MQRPSPATVLPVTALVASLVLALATGPLRLGADPSFQIGVAFALVVTFGLIWGFGARYADVGWMIVITTLLAFKAAARGMNVGSLATTVVDGTLELATMLAFAGFLLCFFRIGLGRGRFELAFGVTLAIYAVVLAAVPTAIRADIGLVHSVPRYVGAALMLYAAIHGLTTIRALLPRRQRHVVVAAGAGIVASISYALSPSWLPGAGGRLATPLLDHALAVTLGVLLVADLVIFHRDYLKSRQERVLGKDTAEGSSTQRELARGARDLMLGRAQPGSFEDFRFDWHHRGEGGTLWHDLWRTDGELRLLFGHVTSSGSLAPVAALTVLCLLSEAKTRAMTTAETARYLNLKLLELFERRVQVTFAAVSLGSDGSLEVFNAGEPGFFHVSRDGARLLSPLATPLGAVPDLEPAHEPVPLVDGDVLFAAGRSIIEGSQTVGRLLDFFDDVLDFTPSVPAVKDAVLRIAAAPATDDQLMLLIERYATGDQQRRSG